ncbi:CPBP family intramembrane glutamic endopeptidase [Clostridium thermobutyricum]|uniref:CPBP family intramembrane glutamic endopeptidase n=1 Tax=Clostridium thermobutyricum TaxID=29372 RepID=UPI0018AB7E0E|nr:CPBP family intramembrane glutamic endopeptidase [Clostridium thermobutyricum]
MKKFFKTIGICLGLPILNLIIISIIQLIAANLIFKNIDTFRNNMFSLVLIGNIINLIIISFILSSKEYRIKDRIKIKKIPIKKYINILILSIGMTILMLFLSGILSNLLHSYNNVANQLLVARVSIVQSIITVILIPIYEEIFYRGIIFGYLRKNFNGGVAVLIQALVFGVVHLNLVQSIYTFILGIILAIIYIYSDSILGSITAHIIFNLLGLIVLPTLVAKIPSIGIVLLIIGFIFSIFSIVKIIKVNKKSI